MKALTRSSAYMNPATTPRRNFCFPKVSSICSIVWKGYRPLVPLGRIRTSVSVRYGFEKYAYRLRASLAIAPAAMSAVPAESAARWSSQAIFRQKNFHAHDPPERALDFHVKAGQDWNVPP